MDHPDLISCLLLGLAVWQVTEVWHHGTVWPIRPINAWAYRTVGSPNRFLNWLASLLTCPFCHSVWIAAGLAALWYRGPGVPACWVLAALRIAQLGNDLTHAWSRSPTRLYDEEVESLEVDEHPAVGEEIL